MGVEPFASVEVDLRNIGGTPLHIAALIVETDDAAEPVVAISLVGDGRAPVLGVSPLEHDFGAVDVGCRASVPILLSNTGSRPLVVDELEYVSGSAELALDVGTSAPPWTIRAGTEVEVWVDYTPLDAEADVGHLRVWSDDSTQPVATATQSGGSTSGASVEDVFEQPIRAQTDILFAADWTPSMAVPLAGFEDSFEVFVGTLDEIGVDYHVAVVTEDDGCINRPAGSPPYVDPTMALLEQKELFGVMLCEDAWGPYCQSFGANRQRAFTLLEAALSPTNTGSGGCNEGFLRRDASLALIGLSGHPEGSTYAYEVYVHQFQGLKSDPGEVVMHAIGGDYPTGCERNQAYTGFYEATVATGGLMLSICVDDFDDHMVQLAEAAANERASFRLSEAPVEETLEVLVNGVPTPEGWSFDAGSSRLAFDQDSVPEGGSTIAIRYARQVECSD